MPATDDEPDELESQDEDGDDLEDVEDDDEVDAALSLSDEDEEPVEESLEALRDRRPAALRRSSDEDGTDEDDIMSLTSERQDPARLAIPERADPLRDRQEFVCSRCHLVKARSQLADKEQTLCRDCA